MVETAGGSISFSFPKLQRLRLGFDELAEGRPRTAAAERTLLRLARQLGAVAVPTVVRELAGADEDRARWAYAVLGAIADRPRHTDRVIAALRQVVAGAAPDLAKLRALSLLGDLGIEMATPTDLVDPDAARSRSLSDLARCLVTTADVARAAELLIDQLAENELCEFIDDLAETEPAHAAALATEMLVRDDLHEKTRGEIRRLSAPLPLPAPAARPRMPRTLAVQLGRHSDGRRVVLAQARRAGSKPARWRVYCGLISPDEILVDGHYVDDLTHGQIRREVVIPLEKQGFELEVVDARAARPLLARAARAARVVMPRVPRTYYVARDLFGLSDEHLGPARSLNRDHARAALLARGTDLLAAGELERARPILERYIAEAPDDAEGCAALGLCTLASGNAELARRYLDRAVWLQPASGRHLWNLAAAAHRCGRRGACYLALTRYLEVEDDEDPPERNDRGDLARHYIAEYERLARVHHPGMEPSSLAMAEPGSAAVTVGWRQRQKRQKRRRRR